MKLLIYAFGPYGKYTSNISASVLDLINTPKGAKKIIFADSFEPNTYIEKIEEFKPDYIIGLGMCQKGSRLRLEQKAINKKFSKAKNISGKIKENGPDSLNVSLNLEEDTIAEKSYSAGRYACNFSMYTILDYLLKNKYKTKFAFIHIPRSFDPVVASNYLEKQLSNIS